MPYNGMNHWMSPMGMSQMGMGPMGMGPIGFGGSPGWHGPGMIFPGGQMNASMLSGPIAPPPDRGVLSSMGHNRNISMCLHQFFS
jgi:hypothetical protein